MTSEKNPAGEAESTGQRDPMEAMKAAIKEVRREGYKVAILYGLVDAVVVLLAANLVVQTVDVATLDQTLYRPPAASTWAVAGDLTTGRLIVIGLGAATFIGEVWWRVRQPLVERFEAANPEVHEALRTARDALARDTDTPMARALYQEVIERLGATSSLGLVSVGRLAVTMVVIVALSLAAIQVSVAAIQVSPGSFTDGGSASDGAVPGEGGSGQVDGQAGEGGQFGSSDDVLGDPEDVEAGSENLSAAVPSGPGSGEEQGRVYDSDGYSGQPVQIEAQQAGYAAAEDVENAELIKEYNLQIREQDRDRS